jgi:hypothetical protein
MGPMRQRIEIQIRSRDMHYEADMGVAAHWAYKEGKRASVKDVKKFRWLRELLDILEQEQRPEDFWENTKLEMADFNLDVDNPFTTPDRTILFKKPRKMEYPQNNVRFRHYGKNIERLVKEAVKKEDPKEREEAAIYIGKLMKTFFGAWNKENLDDSVIVKDIGILSQGKLTLSLDKVREENLFEKLYREPRKSNSNNNRQQGGERGENRNQRSNRPFKKNRHQHRRRDQ